MLSAESVERLSAGNDLARVLHWGGSMGSYASYSARDMLRAVNQSTVALLDRWNVNIQPTVHGLFTCCLLRCCRCVRCWLSAHAQQS